MYSKSLLSVFLAASLLMQPLWGQGAPSPSSSDGSTAPVAEPAQPKQPRPDYSKGNLWWPHFLTPYQPAYVAEANFADTNRLERLLRDGNIYLSLQDAIALALENNLDIAVQRYGPLIADTDILRARAGGFVRGGATGVSSQSTGASATGGVGGGATGGTGGVSTVSSNASGGPAIPQLEPVMSGSISWGHFSQPLTNTVTTGTNTQIFQRSINNYSYSQGFLTGTSFSLGFNNTGANSNILRNVFNPSLQSSLSLTIQQSLTQGFGRSINARQIRIARNNREVSDLAFKQQVIQTVSQIQNLYWDLASFIDDVRVKQQSLQLAEKLYNDNKRQVEIGTLAPIEIVRAEAEVAARQQDLTISQTQVQQQETILKNALSKSGVANPLLAEAHITPTTRITIPQVEPIEPVQDLISSALQARPELAQSRIGLTNTDINLKAVRNAMLPNVSVFSTLTNNGLAGEVNPNFVPIPGTPSQLPSSLFLGGLGANLDQIFSRKFPDYSVGVNLTIPLRNRSAQADMASAELQHRQQEIRLRQSENSVRVEVRNALIALQQARARMEAATKSRLLQEQTLDAEQKKYALGASTIFLVIQAQRDLAQARSVEVAAMNNYMKARVELDRSTGQTLSKNNISLEEAYEGSVSKPPDPLPARRTNEE